MSQAENTLIRHKHTLVCINEELSSLDPLYRQELEYIKQHFCGIVCSTRDDLKNSLSADVITYSCGDIKQNNNRFIKDQISFVIKELAYNYEDDSKEYKIVNIGEVPINIHNMGVYFKQLFALDKNYFDTIRDNHQFQALTESNKSGQAFRKGIYLTTVSQQLNDNEIQFNLLRCSTNLNGPTDNFRDIDREVVDKVNHISKLFFEEEVELNHVLAQIYQHISQVQNNKKIEKKAVIKAHSDKTKDMPRTALIAFTTFYKFNNDTTTPSPKSRDDLFDICYKNTSVLTKLHFRLKSMVQDPLFVKEFSVTLYPNSVFIIPLSTNRMYTHEIKSSPLPIDKLPTRMGYVIRCSKTKAVFKDNQTYIEEDGNYIKLEEAHDYNITILKELYLKENSTNDVIDYDKIHFSLNSGDYTRPIV